MGVQSLWKELRENGYISEKWVTLQQLNDHIKKTKLRRARIAIDFGLWSMELRSIANNIESVPEKITFIRNLFTRLLSLYGCGLDAIFVFDGAKRPNIKRQKIVDKSNIPWLEDIMRLINIMKFKVQKAPGEAEAECARLLNQGYVDYIISKDVDVFHFGAKQVITEWSKIKGEVILKKVTLVNDLSQNDFQFVALISGCDYSKGLPKIGVKFALIAAKNGYAQSFFNAANVNLLKNSHENNSLINDIKIRLNIWKEDFVTDLKENRSGIFTRKKTLIIPDDFPDIQVLDFLQNPIVGSGQPIWSKSSTLNETFNPPFTEPDFSYLYRYLSTLRHSSSFWSLVKFSSEVGKEYARKLIYNGHGLNLISSTTRIGNDPILNKNDSFLTSSFMDNIDNNNNQKPQPNQQPLNSNGIPKDVLNIIGERIKVKLNMNFIRLCELEELNEDQINENYELSNAIFNKPEDFPEYLNHSSIQVPDSIIEIGAPDLYKKKFLTKQFTLSSFFSTTAKRNDNLIQLSNSKLTSQTSEKRKSNAKKSQNNKSHLLSTNKNQIHKDASIQKGKRKIKPVQPLITPTSSISEDLELIDNNILTNSISSKDKGLIGINLLSPPSRNNSFCNITNDPLPLDIAYEKTLTTHTYIPNEKSSNDKADDSASDYEIILKKKINKRKRNNSIISISSSSSDTDVDIIVDNSITT